MSKDEKINQQVYNEILEIVKYTTAKDLNVDITNEEFALLIKKYLNDHRTELKGDKGESGHDGKSAYELACENGFVGTVEEWLESLKGEEGINYIITDYDYEKIANAVIQKLPNAESVKA